MIIEPIRNVILAPIAVAAQSSAFPVTGGRPVTVLMHSAVGLVAAQYGDLQVSYDGGTTWKDLYVEGDQVRLSSTNTSITVYGAGIYRIDKDITTNATGITITF